MCGKPAMTWFKCQVHIYGSETITYLNAILRAYRYRDFCSGRHMIQTCPKLSCLTAEKSLMLFKGPGFLKKVLKIAEM
jgi:hypothetical protein